MEAYHSRDIPSGFPNMNSCLGDIAMNQEFIGYSWVPLDLFYWRMMNQHSRRYGAMRIPDPNNRWRSIAFSRKQTPIDIEFQN